jgi:hypoxanthine phosphoribosyltransferase
LCDALIDLKQGFYTEFVRVSSYDGLHSTGKLNVGGGLKYKELEGKDVIIVEDIVDTGTTLFHFMPILKEEAKPLSIEICTLLTKRLSEPSKTQAKYVGFSIPPLFVIGYGLDYNEVYRDLKDIWIISQKGIDFDPKTWHS